MCSVSSGCQGCALWVIGSLGRPPEGTFNPCCALDMCFPEAHSEHLVPMVTLGGIEGTPEKQGFVESLCATRECALPGKRL